MSGAALSRRLLLAALLGSAGAAGAEPQGQHQLSVFLRSGGELYLSDARTMGGLGGGVGLRDTWNEWLVLQADVGYLSLLGNVAAVRLGAGCQRPSFYSPALLLEATLLAGDQLAFVVPSRPLTGPGPAFTLGLAVAPLRFRAARTQVSLLELAASIGNDLPGWGFGFSLGLIEVSADL